MQTHLQHHVKSFYKPVILLRYWEVEESSQEIDNVSWSLPSAEKIPVAILL